MTLRTITLGIKVFSKTTYSIRTISMTISGLIHDAL